MNYKKAYGLNSLPEAATRNEDTATDYDYIIAGAGCAGLSLVMHMIHCGGFSGKKILLVDKDIKNSNDRTWCFWEREESLFQAIVLREWQQLWFHSDSVSKLLHTNPYKYKLIRGIDFYNYCRQAIALHPNITFLQAPVEHMVSTSGETVLVAGGRQFRARYIFNSIPSIKPKLQPHQYWLLQHFKGWTVKTDEAVFQPGTATLMDFRISQERGTAFFYILPFTKNKALVEFTVFSKDLLQDDEYEKELKNYVERQLKINSYTIEEKEFGVIPMTNYSFPACEHNIIHIGIAGGQTKASSGYTFRFIQKQSEAIVNNLLQARPPFTPAPSKSRFHFYDSILLNILHHNKMQGNRIFSPLFSNNKTADVLKFLDNETSLREEIKIIRSLPTAVFFKSAVQQVWKSIC